MGDYVYDKITFLDSDKIGLENSGEFIVSPKLFEKLVKLKVGDVIVFAATPDGVIDWFNKVDKRHKMNIEMSKGNYNKVLSYEIKRLAYRNGVRMELLKLLVPLMKDLNDTPKMIQNYKTIVKELFEFDIFKRDKNAKTETE